jgi:hypothetical protein
MKPVTASFAGTLLTALVANTGAMAQNPYAADITCRQYADQAVAPMRAQSSNNQVGSALLGAGLGAALGAAAGGGRGAGIGAASGAIVGTGVGASNAQADAGYISQQYNAYYYSCMQSQAPAPPAYGAPQGYPAGGYAPQPGYAPQQPYGGYAPQPYGYR